MRLTIKTLYLFVISTLIALSAQASNERVFRVINAANGLADNSSQYLVCTKTGRMIISTLGNLNFYDGNSFTHINTSTQFQYQLPLYKGNYHLYFDRRHHLWVKNTYSVTCVDLSLEQFVTNVDSVFRNDLQCQDLVQDLFTDRNGSNWLLTENGLYSVNEKKYYNVLKDRNLQDVDVYDDKILLTFYDNGEEVGQDIDTGKTIHRTKSYEWDDAEKYSSSSLLYAYKDGYFQIRNGEKESILMWFDLTNLKWSILKRMEYHMNGIAKEDDGHVLHIPSEYGYWTYDIETKEFEHIENLRLTTGKTLNTDCNTMAFDKQGGMWIGTEKRGLLYARPGTSRFKTYTWDQPEALEMEVLMREMNQNITEFNGKKANCMYTDSRGWSWFGTTYGLYLYRTPKSEPVIFTRRTGLLNNVIHAVVEDKKHNIWISTSCGISCIMFEGEKIIFVNSFNIDDNVPNESFVNSKAICLDDGTIAMQAIDHVIVFNPEDFDMVNIPRPIKLYPKLVRMMVNGNFVEPRKSEENNVIIDKAISRIYDISLNSDQNNLSLTFSGLNYFRPLQTYYRVRVLGAGLDSDWKVYSYYNTTGNVDYKGMLHLPLLGLLPGEYSIEVQASMFPNQWPERPYVWKVFVNQPWWRTTGVYMVLLFVLIVFLVVNFFLYNKNMKMRSLRNNEESDMIRKIRSFVERCDSFDNESLSVTQEELYGDIQDTKSQLSPKFIKVMLKLIPFVHSHAKGELTMNLLSKEAGMDIVEFYNVISGELYKSPRELMKLTRLQKSVKLLRDTKKSVEEVAKECGFATTNYFIGSFFHQFKVTPLEYRDESN